ncbi:amine dehydrogenase large subunit [Devosia sp. FKR38]|uniref:amine dehydrogenase large subunit n=1 Tax=Devosia sp. FKR38 TaxID=2562312 RepID=UPI001485351F|nr:amine dehydrogenase large subunit [Devosia sp. FKR38]
MANRTAAAFGLLCVIAGAYAPTLAFAQAEEFVPETVTTKERMDPGQNVFVNMQNWGGGPSVAYIYDAKDLTLKGSVSGGSQSHFTISADGNTAYMASGYYPRYDSGAGEHVLQIFDVPTNALTKEIVLPYKLAQYTDDIAFLRLSSDEKLIYIQNATPATSVTVVDLTSGTVVQEVPTPGCFGIYPTLEDHGFSTICNDGAFTTFTLSEDGTSAESQKSAKIFDPDADPIYLSSDRAEGNLLFISYHANVYRLDDSKGVIEKLSVTPIAEGVEGNWGTSGYSVVTYNEPNGILFVPMHSEHHDGSHYHGSEEVWAYDLKNKTLLYRSPLADLTAIHVTDEEVPQLFGLSLKNTKIYKFDVDPTAKFAAKQVAEHSDFGFATTLMASP